MMIANGEEARSEKEEEDTFSLFSRSFLSRFLPPSLCCPPSSWRLGGVYLVYHTLAIASLSSQFHLLLCCLSASLSLAFARQRFQGELIAFLGAFSHESFLVSSFFSPFLLLLSSSCFLSSRLLARVYRAWLSGYLDACMRFSSSVCHEKETSVKKERREGGEDGEKERRRSARRRKRRRREERFEREIDKETMRMWG